MGKHSSGGKMKHIMAKPSARINNEAFDKADYKNSMPRNKRKWPFRKHTKHRDNF